MNKILSIFVLSLMLLNGAAYAADQSDPQNKRSPLTVEQATQALHDGKPVYSCPMKPDWFSDKPGQGPCTGVSLEKVTDVKNGKAVFEEGNSMNMDMKGMDMKNMPMKENVMEKR